jgi:hypothetical protein
MATHGGWSQALAEGERRAKGVDDARMVYCFNEDRYGRSCESIEVPLAFGKGAMLWSKSKASHHGKPWICLVVMGEATTRSKTATFRVEEVMTRPGRTAPLGLEQYIAGCTLVCGDNHAGTDPFLCAP